MVVEANKLGAMDGNVRGLQSRPRGSLAIVSNVEANLPKARPRSLGKEPEQHSPLPVQHQGRHIVGGNAERQTAAML